MEYEDTLNTVFSSNKVIFEECVILDESKSTEIVFVITVSVLFVIVVFTEDTELKK